MNDGRICVSIFAATSDELLKKFEATSGLADVVEIRFDYLLPTEARHAVERLSEDRTGIPLIATFRPREQGGGRDLTFEERVEFWNFAAGRFWAADLEEDIAGSIDSFPVRICSHHEFTAGLSDPDRTVARLRPIGCDVVKIAETVEDASDAVPLWKTFTDAVKTGAESIPVAMGEAGKWTRILNLAHGAFLTYSALDPSSATAPGQIAAQELRDLYRVRELTKETRVYGILAGSTAHSMSPYIQNAAIRETGVNSVFVPLQVLDLSRFFRRMVTEGIREIELNFHGFAVTIPHKRAIMQLLDSVDETAAAIGAVNTVLIEDGKLRGSNTDAAGFIAPLISEIDELRDCRVAIVGSGGAARACIYALSKEGADVTVFARNAEQGRALALEFGIAYAQYDVIDEAPDFSNFDVVVNATPLGSSGPFEDLSIAGAKQLRGCRIVYDLVYNPVKTRLLREAESAGVRSLNGLEMLVNQGAKQFEIWNRREAPVDVMRAAALERSSRLR